MSCHEFRRLSAGVRRLDGPEFLAHRRECPACAAFADEHERVDALLAQVMTVAVDPALQDRLIAIAGDVRTPRRLGWRQFAVAATLLLALGIVWKGLPEYRDDALARAIVDNVTEQLALPDGDYTGAVTEARAMLNDLGLDLRSAELAIEKAWPCAVNGKIGVHLVTTGARGPVSILLMPAEDVSARRNFAHAELQGAIIPWSVGSLAIVGRSGESLAPIEAQVRRAIVTL